VYFEVRILPKSSLKEVAKSAKDFSQNIQSPGETELESPRIECRTVFHIIYEWHNTN
jgi:hypothetical protein